MLIKRAADLRSSDITDRQVYLNRREFLGAAAAATAAVATGVLGTDAFVYAATPAPHARKLENVNKTSFGADEKPNKWEEITTYNNFYEFGIDKDSPSTFARNLKTESWTVAVDGECAKRGNMPLEDILKGETLEERIYRHRCVEAWSMVVPWTGFALKDLMKMISPKAEAKYVQFQTFNNPDMAPGQKPGLFDSYPWPYTEGLTIAEAMNDLAFVPTGAYGKELPKPMGAPIRLHLPWKYGFKSVKSIVKISLVKERPMNFWQAIQASEYGFWANVNPAVPHPRWSQAQEQVLGTEETVPTKIFNGYGEFVADLYKGMEKEPLYM